MAGVHPARPSSDGCFACLARRPAVGQPRCAAAEEGDAATAFPGPVTAISLPFLVLSLPLSLPFLNLSLPLTSQDPTAPNRGRTAYLIFCTEVFPSMMQTADFKAANFKSRAQRISAAWKV